MKYKGIPLIIILLTTVVIGIVAYVPPAYSETPPSPVGYRVSAGVLHIWNDLDSYYFNVSSGIQFSNHYEEYWSHNVMGLGYFVGGEWNVMFWTDTLSGFTKSVDTDDETYVNVTLYKDLSYSGYEFRFAIRYNLELGDPMLTVQPYIKNLGDDIPYELGFAWRLKDLNVGNSPYDNEFSTWWNIDEDTMGGDTYYLNEDLDKPYDLPTSFSVTNTEKSQSLDMVWTADTTLFVKSQDGQYNAPVSIFIKIGTLAPDQEKTTQFLWHDADIIDSFTTAQADFITLDALHPSAGADESAYGQAFTCPVGYKITSASFRLNKQGLPTGNAHFVLYSISGTYGTNAVPTGAALGTSDNFDVSTLGGAFSVENVAFTGGDQYDMDPGYYFIVYENPTAGLINGANDIRFNRPVPSTHDGNGVRWRNGDWNAQSVDAYFVVYGERLPTQTLLSFPFDGDGISDGTTDHGDYNNNGNIIGATRTYFGYMGKALDFNGSNQGVLIPDDVTLDCIRNFTIMVWLNTSLGWAGDVNRTIISKTDYADAAAGGYGIYVSTTGDIGFQTSDGAVFDIGSWGTVVTADTWTHIAVTWAYVTNTSILYVNGVSQGSVVLTSEVTANAYDLLIGGDDQGTDRWFNGTLDEFKIFDDTLSQAEVAGNMTLAVVTYPYTDYVEVTDIAPGDWIYVDNTYTFEAVFVRRNSSYSFDTQQFGFSDGVEWTNVTYDVVADSWTTSSDVVAFISTSESSGPGNAYILTIKMFFESGVSDAINVDVYGWVNNTVGGGGSWEVAMNNYLNIYNEGGSTAFESSGDAFQIKGEIPFGMAAQVAGSWGRTNLTVSGLQKFVFDFTLWSNTSWDAPNTRFDCPSEHANTGYVEVGVDYIYNGVWIEGWKCHIEIIDGMAAANNAWVLLNVSWYNRESYVKSDLQYAYYEAHVSNDTTTQIHMQVVLWVSKYDASSKVGGRVNPNWFGMKKTGWLLWTTWKPLMAHRSSSYFMDNMLDTPATSIISAKGVYSYNLWVCLNKTAADAGAPDCDSHQWAIRDCTVDWVVRPQSLPYVGIGDPMQRPTQVVDWARPSSVGDLLTKMANMIRTPIVDAIAMSGAVLSTAFNEAVNIAGEAIGVPDLIPTTTGLVESMAEYFATSVTNFVTMIAAIFTLFGSISGFIILWGARFINTFVQISTIVVNIFNGTQTGVGAILDIWAVFNINEWIDAIPVFAFIVWFASVDSRAKTMGQWVGIFVGDIQMMISIVSYIVSIYFMVINFVINVTLAFINAWL